MIIGVPTEIQPNENRVAIAPSGVVALVKKGHTVLIEKNAGLGSSFTNEDYEKCGAEIVSTPKELYNRSKIILKVKAPQLSEYNLLKKEQILMAYLHLVAESELTKALQKNKITAIAFETIQRPDGSLPVLRPMSEIAGKMSVQIGAQFLENYYGGKGLLLGGVPGTRPSKVTIIGAGNVGKNAAQVAVGNGCEVSILDINIDRLRYINDIMYSKVKTIVANSITIEKEVKTADLVISAVLIPGSKPPIVVTEDMVKKMKKGSVIVDAAIDQGGSVETINRMTTHDNPVFEKYGIIHYAVPNMPGSVAKTASIAMNNVSIPYVISIADNGIKAVKHDSALAKGINVIDGAITYKPVADGLFKEYTPLESIIGF